MNPLDREWKAAKTGDGTRGQTGRFLVFYRVMARLARIVVANVPHHVTQRGNARQLLLASDGERSVYLELLRQYVQLHDLSLLGYCLMSNHMHLVVVPRKTQALALALKQTHGRYASYWNASHKSSGHVWQDHRGQTGRFLNVSPVAGRLARIAIVTRRRTKTLEISRKIIPLCPHTHRIRIITHR